MKKYCIVLVVFLYSVGSTSEPFRNFWGTWSLMEILSTDGMRIYDGDLNVPYELCLLNDGNVSAEFYNRHRYKFNCAGFFVQQCSTVVIVDTAISALVYTLKIHKDHLHGTAHNDCRVYKMIWKKVPFNWPVSKKVVDSLRSANGKRIKMSIPKKKFID